MDIIDSRCSWVIFINGSSDHFSTMNCLVKDIK